MLRTTCIYLGHRNPFVVINVKLSYKSFRFPCNCSNKTKNCLNFLKDHKKTQTNCQYLTYRLNQIKKQPLLKRPSVRRKIIVLVSMQIKQANKRQLMQSSSTFRSRWRFSFALFISLVSQSSKQQSTQLRGPKMATQPSQTLQCSNPDHI